MDDQYERILLFFVKIRWIKKYAVLLEPVRAFPLNSFRTPERVRRKLGVKIGKALRRVARRRHVVKLGRMRCGTADKSDFATDPDEGVDPKGPGRTDVTDREFFGGAVERLDPQRCLCCVMSSQQQ